MNLAVAFLIALIVIGIIGGIGYGIWRAVKSKGVDLVDAAATEIAKAFPKSTLGPGLPPGGNPAGNSNPKGSPGGSPSGAPQGVPPGGNPGGSPGGSPSGSPGGSPGGAPGEKGRQEPPVSSTEYCEGGVCVKRPPNCFGAKSGADEDCMTCGEAQRAYAQRGWAWLGNMPDAALFCRTWPTPVSSPTSFTVAPVTVAPATVAPAATSIGTYQGPNQQASAPAAQQQQQQQPQQQQPQQQPQQQQQAPVTQPSANCPALCQNYTNRGAGPACKLYVSAAGWCGADVFMTADGKDYGWGQGYVERNRATITDCTQCP